MTMAIKALVLEWQNIVLQPNASGFDPMSAEAFHLFRQGHVFSLQQQPRSQFLPSKC
jgi:hypothetical protein